MVGYRHSCHFRGYSLSLSLGILVRFCFLFCLSLHPAILNLQGNSGTLADFEVHGNRKMNANEDFWGELTRRREGAKGEMGRPQTKIWSAGTCHRFVARDWSRGGGANSLFSAWSMRCVPIGLFMRTA